MLTLSAKTRKEIGRKVKLLRNKGILPAVLYGPEIKPQAIEVALKEFRKIYKEVGESSLFSIQIEKEKIPVLVHETKRDALTGEIIHVDFYQPILTQEVEATVPLVFEGVASAVKDLAGTLVREIQEIKVKALPQNLPHSIKVNIEGLKTFENEVLIKDILVPEGVKIQREPDEIVVHVVPPQKVEEELAKPIEEKVEDVEKVEKEKKEKEEPIEGEKPVPAKGDGEAKPTEKK